MSELQQVVGMQLTAPPVFVLVLDANDVAHSQVVSAMPVPKLRAMLASYLEHFDASVEECGDQHEVWLDVTGVSRRDSVCDLPKGHEGVTHEGVIDDQGTRASWLGGH